MATVQVLNVEVLNPVARLLDPLSFRITVNCLAPLPDDLEFKVVWVSSAKDDKADQELESVLVGPVPVGVSRFELETRAPDPAKIPEEDLLGATVVMLVCLYRGRRFARVGYWVATAAEGVPEGEPPPSPCPPERVTRSVAADKPRVTRFNCEWA